MKNYIQFVTTEGLERYNARGMDCIFNIKGKDKNNVKIRFDISPKIYQQAFNDKYMREEMIRREIERQINLLENTNFIIFTHGHNDHFWTEILEYDENNINKYGYKINADFTVYYPHCLNNENYTKNTQYTIKEELKKRVEILKKYSPRCYEIGAYARAKYNGIEIEMQEVKHSTYKGFDLGKVLTVNITTPENKKIFFSSDVSGPEYNETRNLIIDKNPNIILLDGPYNDILSVLGNGNKQVKKSISELKKSYENLYKIISKTTDLKEIILMHHFMRNIEIKNDIQNIPEYLKDKICNNKIENKFKEHTLLICNKIEEYILSILDKCDDKEIEIYTPSILKNETIKF
ncbi:MAG: hypothetical protein QW469_02205 [Candidatus Aenigmatarchaeota archaeon]